MSKMYGVIDSSNIEYRKEKARLLLGFITISAAVTFITLMYLGFTSIYKDTHNQLPFFICTPLLVILSLLYFSVREFDYFQLCAHIFIFLSVVGIYGSIMLNGGANEAPPAFAALTLPLMAFALLGKNGGLLWSIFIFVLSFILVTIQAQGHIFPNTLDPEILPQASIFAWLLSLGYMFILSLFYQVHNDRLNDIVNKERDRYHQLAIHDALTRIPNRNWFDEALPHSLERAERQQQKVALLFIDIDHFKQVNDNYGHQKGDQVLQRVANILKNNVRSADTVVRLGGDEFAIACEHITDISAASVIAEKLCRAVETNIPNDINLSVSIGIGVYPDHAKSASSLRVCADRALYKAKERRNGWEIYCEYSATNNSDGSSLLYLRGLGKNARS